MTKQSKSPKEHARVVLEGVPRVNFYDGGERCPEDVPFPSCLRACLEFMGENLGCKHIKAEDSTWRLGCAYAYLMGTSGSAFRLSWGQGWQKDNVEIMYMSADPGAPFRRAFESVGYAHEGIMKEEDRDNETYFRSRIIESIRDKSRPVLGFGVIGPPECCIITGYDNHGNVLIRWNFFQNFPGFKAEFTNDETSYGN